MREEDGRARLDAAKNKGRQEAEAEATKEAEKKEIEMILEMYEDGIPIKQIAKFTKKTEKEISAIIKKHRK